MNDNKAYSKHLNGVGCDVTSCRYNGCNCGSGCTCCADHIQVGSENASRKAETFCSTFEARTLL